MADQQLTFEVLIKMQDEASQQLAALKTRLDQLGTAGPQIAATFDQVSQGATKTTESLKYTSAEAQKLIDWMHSTASAAREAALATGQDLGAGLDSATKAVVTHGRAHEATGGSVTHTTRAVRELTSGLASGLSPALGGATSQLLSVATGAGQLGGGLGVVTVGIAAAVVALTGYFTATEEAAKAQVNLNTAVASLDLAGVKSQLAEATKALEQFDASLLGRLATATRTAGALNLLDSLLGRTQKQEAIGNDQAALEKLYPIASAQQYAEAQLAIAKAMESVVSAQASQAAQLDNINKYVELNRLQVVYLNQQEEAQRKLIDLDAQRQTAAAKTAGQPQSYLDLIERQRQDAQHALDVSMGGRRQALGASGDAGVQSILSRTLAGDATDVGQGFEQAVAGVPLKDLATGLRRREQEDIEKLRSELESQLAGIEGQGFEQAGVGPTLAETDRGLKRSAQADASALDLRRQAVDIQRSSLSLSKDQQDALAAQSIELQRQVALKLAMGDPDKEALANLRAQVEQANLLQEHLQRTDPLEGFRAALTATSDEYTDWGRNMTQMTGDIARTMSDSMSSGFFDVLTGNFKDLATVGQQFAQGLVKSILGELSNQAAGQIIGSVKNLFNSAFPAGAGQAGFVSTGLLAGGIVPAPAAPPAAVQIGGGSAGLIITAGGAERSLSDVSASEGAPITLPSGATTTYSDILRGGAGPGPTGFDDASRMASPSASIASASGFSPNVGNVLGAVGGLGSLGLITAGATQNTTTGGIVASGLAGGLAGIGAGASIASMFGGSATTGGAIGGVAGALVAGGAAAYGKQQAQKAAEQQRQLNELQQASGSASNLVSAAQGAKSLPELVDILSSYQSGSIGGTSNVAVPTSIGGVPISSRAPSGTPAIDAAELIRTFSENPDTQIGVNIQAGVDPSQLAGPNASASKALSQIVSGMVNQFNQQAQGVGVSTRATENGIEHETTVPATRAATLGNADLEVDSVAFSRLSADDAELLLRQLAAVHQDRSLGLFLTDPATGAILSVTQRPLPDLTTPTPGTFVPPVVPNPNQGQDTGSTGGTASAVGAGAALTIGLASQLADPTSLLNKLLPTGYTGPDLIDAIKRLTTTGSLSGDAGTLTASQVEAEGSSIATMNEPADIPPGSEGTFGSAVSSVLGGAGGVLSLVQGAQTGDPLSIVSGIAQLYGAVASGAQALGLGIADVLPTFGQIVGPVVSAVTEAVGAGVGTAAGEALAETGAAVAGAGAALAPVAAVLLIKAAVDLINGIQAADLARFQARHLEIFQNATLPGIVQGVMNAPALLQVILDPNATTDQVKAAAAKVDEALANYNASDIYFQGGMAQQGSAPYQLNQRLAPYLAALSYAKLKAADRLNTAMDPNAVALGYGPAGIRSALLPSFMQSGGPGAQGTVFSSQEGGPSSAFVDRPLTSAADLAGLKAMGLPLTRADGSPIMLSDVVNATSPGGSYQGLTEDTAYGATTKSIESQIASVLTPGSYVTGLQSLGAQYGAQSNPFISDEALAQLFAVSPSLAIALAPQLSATSGRFAPPDGSGAGAGVPSTFVDASGGGAGTPGGSSSSPSSGEGPSGTGNSGGGGEAA